MLTPIFDFSTDSVLLYKGIARVTKNNVKYGGTANILLKFNPKAHLLIKTEFLYPKVSNIMGDKTNDFTISHQELDVFPISSTITFDPRVVSKIDWIPSSGIIKEIFHSRKASKRELKRENWLLKT